MISMGVDSMLAQVAAEATWDANDYFDNESETPEDSADTEMSYWTE